MTNSIISVRLLLDLSSHVRSLHIHQISGGGYFGAHYLFGVFDVDWVPIILEMFSNKLDKLYIDNRWYQNYLSKQGADDLKEVRALHGAL